MISSLILSREARSGQPQFSLSLSSRFSHVFALCSNDSNISVLTSRVTRWNEIIAQINDSLDRLANVDWNNAFCASDITQYVRHK